MSLSTLMVHIGPVPQLDGRVHLAIELAQRFGCPLIGISAAVLPPYPSGEGAYFVNQEFVERERRDIVESLRLTEVAFREAAGANMKVDWRSAVDLPENYVVSEARATDLLIVGRGNGDVCRSLSPGDVVLKTGRPLLVVPPEVTSLKGERILVGWKDCREARRALYDALPVLRHAQSVVIAEICDEGASSWERRHLADCCEYLHRNGISAVCTEHLSRQWVCGATANWHCQGRARRPYSDRRIWTQPTWRVDFRRRNTRSC